MSKSNWEPVIGLEIHAQLKTKSKIFSSENASFGGGDNENIGIVSLGMPGSLPVLNWSVVEAAVKVGLALNCKINLVSEFARKNYFYPDLPKGYQISQYDKPICGEGRLDFDLDGQRVSVGIERAHLEEDAGKSIHQGNQSLLNFNRAGVPLLEIVSKPEIHSAAVAAQYARAMRSVLVYLDASDGNLEEGSLRCDCNVSVRPKGSKELRTRVEIKNLNSFRFIEKAVEYEIERQILAYQNNEQLFQETRLYDSTKNKTFSMRSKEEAEDYRYFPDPDLPAIEIDIQRVEDWRKNLPEMPLDKKERFVKVLGLGQDEADILVQDKHLANFFEAVVGYCNKPKTVASWVLTEVLRELNESGLSIDSSPVGAKDFADLINLVEQGRLSGKMAKLVFAKMWKTQKTAEIIVAEEGLAQITDEDSIRDLVEEVLAQSPELVEEYRSGKTKVYGFFVGQVMKLTKGQANPELVNRLLKRLLSN